VIAVAAASAQAAPSPGPASEVYSADKVDLPAVPDFALASTTGDVHDVKELRVAGQPLLDTDIKVQGYVIWIYDCIGAIRTPGESKAATQERIDADPTLCERAKLYLGETKTTPPEKGLWIVDFPRPPGKLEKERLPKEKLDAWPVVPKVKVGDYVTISGHFAVQSPHKERNSDGLLVFASIAPARPSRSGKPTPMALRATATPAIPKAPPEQPIAKPARDRSILALDEGNRLLGDEAVQGSTREVRRGARAVAGQSACCVWRRDRGDRAAALPECEGAPRSRGRDRARPADVPAPGRDRGLRDEGRCESQVAGDRRSRPDEG